MMQYLTVRLQHAAGHQAEHGVDTCIVVTESPVHMHVSVPAAVEQLCKACTHELMIIS